jgi:hypothetical protein
VSTPQSPHQSQTTINPPQQLEKDEIKNDGLQQVVENKEQQTFEWIISQQSSENKTETTTSSSAISSPSEDNSNFEDVFSSSKTAKTPPDFWPTSSLPIRNLSTDLFEGWNNGKSSNSKIPEIQKPSDVWRFGSTSSVNDSTLGGFWSWNPSSSSKTITASKNTRSESTSSSGSSSDEPSGGWLNPQSSGRHNMTSAENGSNDFNRRLGSTGWSSTGPSSVHGSTESLTLTSSVSAFRAFDNEENFFLGESLLQNLTNFKTRNETLV